jgi:hypothetical protein
MVNAVVGNNIGESDCSLESCRRSPTFGRRRCVSLTANDAFHGVVFTALSVNIPKLRVGTSSQAVDFVPACFFTDYEGGHSKEGA